VNIKIKWLYDESDCDDCGSTYAEGAEILLGDEVILLEPVAYCCGSQSWDERAVFTLILEKLGHQVEMEDGGLYEYE